MYVNDLTKQRLEFPSRKGSLLEEGTIHRWIYLYQILRKYLFSFPFCAPFSTTGTTTDSRQPQGSREILLLPFTSTEVGQRWLYVNLGKASGTFTTTSGGLWTGAAGVSSWSKQPAPAWRWAGAELRGCITRHPRGCHHPPSEGSTTTDLSRGSSLETDFSPLTYLVEVLGSYINSRL